MRIGIDARQISHRKRHGLRTYVENLIQALSRVDSANEYVLYLDSKDPYCLDNLGPNFSIRILPWHFKFVSTLLNDHLFFPRQVKHDRLDIIHFTTGASKFFPSLTAPATVITVHDALPFFNRWESILRYGIINTLFNKYNSALLKHNLSQRISVITISENSRNDLLRLTAIHPERTSVVYEAANANFRITEANAKDNTKEKYHLGKRFILGFAHKNGTRVVEAYASLPPRLKQGIRLGLIWQGKEFPGYLKDVIRANDAKDNVICIPPVSEEELVLLYNAASLFVFPSFYEGFGLPVLEAMRCGCPVISSDRGSLPEVGGDAVLYVHELDDVNLCVKELASNIQAALENDELRDQMKHRGMNMAKRFSWENTAAETLTVYRKACGITK